MTLINFARLLPSRKPNKRKTSGHDGHVGDIEDARVKATKLEVQKVGN